MIVRKGISLFFTLLILVIFIGCESKDKDERPAWLINYPQSFRRVNLGTSNLRLRPNMGDTFIDYVKDNIDEEVGYGEGEFIDAVEHFFWLNTDGISLEVGAMDGSSSTHSVTAYMEYMLGWKRIIVEGNPHYRYKMARKASQAISVSAVICDDPNHTKHFATKPYVGGILEYIPIPIMRKFFPDILQAYKRSQSFDRLDYKYISPNKVIDVSCTRLSDVLKYLKATRINFFALDVEGAELEVLNSIDWRVVRFDVICVETDPYRRPHGYADLVVAFLTSKGYEEATKQLGKNIWFIHSEYKPSKKPNLQCYNGKRKADHARAVWKNETTTSFKLC